MSIITVQNLQVNYDKLVALKEVSFKVNEHEFIGIIGPNGGGKTTLLKTIIGTLKPTRGSVYIHKDEVIGYVPQLTTFDRQFPITVEDVILVGHLPKRIKILQKFSKEEKEHAQDVMKTLGILDLKDRQIGMLSGGQMQRVLIARALMNHPTILILDEPTAGVDTDSKHEIYKLLLRLNNTLTIMMITHDTNDMMDQFDRIIYINKTIHIHNRRDVDIASVYPEGSFCPIEWFIEGNKEAQNTEGKTL